MSLQAQSLIRYDNPLLISSKAGNANDKKGSHSPSKQQQQQQQGGGAGAQQNNALSPLSKTNKLPPVGGTGVASLEEKARYAKPGTSIAAANANAASGLQTEDLLASILPSREWEENGELWVQRVSSTPATRLDTIALQEQLDALLQKRQARETGICPIRRDIYSQCFDELIRQVTINCQERGLLLLRVRDEIRMTIAAYQTLYESSIAFGMRKALQAEQGKSDLEEYNHQLEEEKRQLEHTIHELKGKIDTIEKREAEKRGIEEKRHADEIAFLKKTNIQLKTQLEGILTPQKK